MTFKVLFQYLAKMVVTLYNLPLIKTILGFITDTYNKNNNNYHINNNNNNKSITIITNK